MRKGKQVHAASLCRYYRPGFEGIHQLYRHVHVSHLKTHLPSTQAFSHFALWEMIHVPPPLHCGDEDGRGVASGGKGVTQSQINLGLPSEPVRLPFSHLLLYSSSEPQSPSLQLGDKAPGGGKNVGVGWGNVIVSTKLLVFLVCDRDDVEVVRDGGSDGFWAVLDVEDKSVDVEDLQHAANESRRFGILAD
jgi:hypothetical protein